MYAKILHSGFTNKGIHWKKKKKTARKVCKINTSLPEIRDHTELLSLRAGLSGTTLHPQVPEAPPEKQGLVSIGAPLPAPAVTSLLGRCENRSPWMLWPWPWGCLQVPLPCCVSSPSWWCLFLWKGLCGLGTAGPPFRRPHLLWVVCEAFLSSGPGRPSRPACLRVFPRPRFPRRELSGALGPRRTRSSVRTYPATHVAAVQTTWNEPRGLLSRCRNLCHPLG